MRNGLSDSESLGPWYPHSHSLLSFSCLDQHPYPNQTTVVSEETTPGPMDLVAVASHPSPWGSVYKTNILSLHGQKHISDGRSST